jgi:hypothetical protein
MRLTELQRLAIESPFLTGVGASVLAGAVATTAGASRSRSWAVSVSAPRT